MIISVANQKGGVGKTITSFMLSNIIADIGQRPRSVSTLIRQILQITFALNLKLGSLVP